MTNIKKIRFLFKNLKIDYYSILKKHLITINYSNNVILKKKHIIYYLLKKNKNK